MLQEAEGVRLILAALKQRLFGFILGVSLCLPYVADFAFAHGAWQLCHCNGLG
jgi:hypothetical protein